MKKYLYNHVVLLFLITIIIFLSKWIFSFYYFNDSIDSKIIFDAEVDGYFYYYYTKYISDLHFLGTDIKSSVAGEAFSSLLLHALLLKFFGFYGFLLAEVICIFIFLLIFYKICRFFDFTNFFSISIPLLIFSIPLIIELSFLNNISILHNFKQIYNLRYPNPLVSNLFLFSFIYFLLRMEKNYILNFKNIFILSIILSITFSSYYYYFVAEVITFFIFILYKEKNRFFLYFNKKIKLFLISLLVFFVISSPFILMLINAEPDYMQRVGSLIIDDKQKKLLLIHFFSKIFSLNFFFIFFVNILITIILKIKKSNYTNFKIIFDLFFISTVISPILFIQFSPKISPLYNFNFTIFIGLFLSIFFGFCFLMRLFLKNKVMIRLNYYINFCLILSLFFINLAYRYTQYSSLNSNENYKLYRKNFSKVTGEIKNRNDFNNIVTFDDKLVIWATLHNFGEIPLKSGVLTSESNDAIESNLFESFKLLGLNENNLLEIFKNKKSSWRFHNRYTQIFFWFRYSANSLTTHNNSTDFNKNDLEFIKTISPLHAHSFAIPRSELIRLKEDFIDFKISSDFNPNYIVIFDKKMIAMIKKKFKDECYIEDSKNLFFLALQNNNCS
jgi:hypothetical protein